MTEKAVLEALQKAVTAAVTALASSKLPVTAVKYVGRNFTKPNTGGWLEVVYIPNNIRDEFWDEGKTYRGMLRLILHWPMEDKGAYEPIQIMDTISQYFAKGSKFADPGNAVLVRINDNPDLMGVMEEPPEMLLPLSIRYHFFRA